MGRVAGGSRRSSHAGAITDIGEDGTYFNFFVFLDEDLFDNTFRGRGNFRIDLVCGHFDNRLIERHGIAQAVTVPVVTDSPRAGIFNGSDIEFSPSI